VCGDCGHSPMEHSGGPCRHVYSTGDVCDCAAFVPDDYPCKSFVAQRRELNASILSWLSLVAVAEMTEWPLQLTTWTGERGST